jgi:hypothetical protein
VHRSTHGRLPVFILTQFMVKHGIQLIPTCIKQVIRDIDTE